MAFNSSPRKPGITKTKPSAFPNNVSEYEKCKLFIQNFTNSEDGSKVFPPQLQAIADRQQTVLHISIDDIIAYNESTNNSSDGEEFVQNILHNTLKYQQLFSRAVDDAMPVQSELSSISSMHPHEIFQAHRESRFRALLEQQKQQQQQQQQPGDNTATTETPTKSPFPVELSRKYELHILPSAAHCQQPQRMRSVLSSSVGALVVVTGIVTRVTDVQPLVTVVTYICGDCGYESYQTTVSDDKQYTPLTVCPSVVCTSNNNSGHLQPQTRGSRFSRHQSLKLQELAEEVPVGRVPRSLNCKLIGSELTRGCKPGDLVTVAGIYLPAPYTGFRAIRSGLTTETYIHVHQLQNKKNSFQSTVVDDAMLQQIQAYADNSNNNSSSNSNNNNSSDIYELLAASIAPEIYGHSDIKKALVLLLVGGVTRSMDSDSKDVAEEEENDSSNSNNSNNSNNSSDSNNNNNTNTNTPSNTSSTSDVKIRGDINILLCGDPGVAKSQLLKFICALSPRGIYTTGKGSSGVGLTAAVVRNDATGEMTLEGGALVLADRGVCAIDEFDKMQEADRTAIHEVMEQQTVSIAKAGIVTTLNARTSILAAANPVFGRYKQSATVEVNIGLPTALLSRFDLTFVILDTPNAVTDEKLAKHITHVHQHSVPPPRGSNNSSSNGSTVEPFSAVFMRAYISRARKHEPAVPTSITDYIVGSYVQLRQQSNSNNNGSNNNNNYSNSNSRTQFCTARMLLSILRLAQAVARVYFHVVVERSDVEEAMRLLSVSKGGSDEDEEDYEEDNIYSGNSSSNSNSNNSNKSNDPMTSIYNIIRTLHHNLQLSTVSKATLRDAVVLRGFSDSQMTATLDEYERLGILQVTNTHVRFMTGAADE